MSNNKNGQFSPAAGRTSTRGSTSSGSRGSRMLPLASHAGACGALRSSPAGAVLRASRAARRARHRVCRRGTCAHTRAPRVPLAAPRDASSIRRPAYHRCGPIGESTRTESAARPPARCKCSGAAWRESSTARPAAFRLLGMCCGPYSPEGAAVATLHESSPVILLPFINIMFVTKKKGFNSFHKYHEKNNIFKNSSKRKGKSQKKKKLKWRVWW